ncbi:MAG: hypothetical protein LH615_12670 [Ferruginibacter sp.]|nr:hypothetical protein [Ferruginibacter sp.]
MKVFVGFGYNNNDKWIKDLIIPFIEELGCEVVSGEDMQGEKLSDGVISRVEDSDACIGFLTKRDQKQDGTYTTHKWVIEELTLALQKKIPLFEIREKEVEAQRGITGDRQRYEITDKAELMFEITKFINKEKLKFTHKTFMLVPNTFVDEIRPFLKSRDTVCKYRFLHKAKFYEPEETKLERMGQGLGIIVKKIPAEEAQIEITVESQNNILWTSGFISVGLINVQLLKD